jgi:hypothetical protein
MPPHLFKSAFAEELQAHWQAMTPAQKAMVLGGGTLALGSGLDMARTGPGVGHLLAALAGAGVAGYGASGGQLPEGLASLFTRPPAHQAAPSPATALASLKAHPTLGRYFQGGKPDVRALAAAPDSELKPALAGLPHATRRELRTQLAGYRPNMVERLGARAAGIDIDQQKTRFGGLLS